MLPWSDLQPGDEGYFEQIPKGDTSYAFQVRPDRKLTGTEVTEMLEFCNNTFGMGGPLPPSDSVWTMNPQTQVFKFKNERDMIVFYVAYCG